MKYPWTILQRSLFLIGLLVIGQCLNYASAQPLMTLDNAIAIGLKNNYNILMARNEEDIAHNDYRYAYGALLPQINLNATRNWSSNNVNQSFSDGRKVDKKNARSNVWNLTGNLNWTLFDGLRMFAAADELKNIRDRGELAVKSQVIQTVASIMNTYYLIVQQKQQLASIAEQMQISEERMRIAQQKFASGLGSKLDVLQAQVDLNAQRSAYLQQQTLIAKTKASLNQLIALPPDQEFEVEDSIPVDTSLQIATLKTAALQQNPDLLIASKDIQIAQNNLQITRAQRFPTISFNTTYSFNRQNAQATNPYQPISNRNLGLTYGFSASIPLFHGFDIKRQIEDAQLNIQYQQINLQQQTSQLQLALQNAYQDYRYYIQAMQLEQSNVAVAKENVRIALAAFEQGQSTTLDVRTAQQGLADAQTRLITARYYAKQAEITLLQLKGNLVQ
ncbi:MAG: TolC family protein, partial [Thermoflavifilum sp.]|nr:TolC family protein [Thermoflavifilum sp.]